jgi:hypothetical protein
MLCFAEQKETPGFARQADSDSGLLHH